MEIASSVPYFTLCSYIKSPQPETVGETGHFSLNLSVSACLARGKQIILRAVQPYGTRVSGIGAEMYAYPFSVYGSRVRVGYGGYEYGAL